MVGFGWPAATVALVMLALAGISYLVLALFHVLRFREGGVPQGAALPPISLLKPLCGAEPRLYDCLRSFCTQDYPALQIIFGVRDSDDPAIAVVDRLRREFPDRDIALVVDSRIHGANLKVSNLMNMMAAARHDIIGVADSDVAVGADGLRSVAASLADAKVGAVTCLYKGAPGGGMASHLGALYINDWFLPSVLVDVALNGTDGCFGALSLLRREALAAAGGFEILSDYLAEDHRMGRLIREAGWTLALSAHTVATMVEEESLAELASHEIRWARTVRACRPLDHVLSLVTFPLPLLLALLALKPGPWGFAFVAVHVVLRMALHLAVHARFALGTRPAPWLVPVREVQCFAIWALSLFGATIRWRGRSYRVTDDGRLLPAQAGADLSGGRVPAFATGDER